MYTRDELTPIFLNGTQSTLIASPNAYLGKIVINRTTVGEVRVYNNIVPTTGTTVLLAVGATQATPHDYNFSMAAGIYVVLTAGDAVTISFAQP